MPDSDDDYIQDISDDDTGTHQVNRSAGPSTRKKAAQNARATTGWEVTRTWENVTEGADGTISSTVEGLLEAGKRKRLLKDTTPLQRGIIRHLILVLDLSTAMAERDLRPTRYLLTLRYAQEFVLEYFEQNPISQLGIIGMRDGLAIRVSDMSGNPNDHVSTIQALREQEPKGNPSLQNALDMARAALFHAPSHGTREILLVFGSLLSSDPGDIHTTITALASSHITVSVIGLAAQIAICKTLVTRTNPAMNPDDAYGVALNEQHYRDLFMKATTPPVTAKTTLPSSRTNGNTDNDHDGGGSKRRVDGQDHARVEKERGFAAHGRAITAATTTAAAAVGVSESGRYECPSCGMFFCIDCDVFAHEVVHNCPGCQSRDGTLMRAGSLDGERMGAGEDVLMRDAEPAHSVEEEIGRLTAAQKGKGKG
ncbi:hypothetical protein MMC19_004579 [Ptychographa xylographoides]|nr:hypothetical protein [Ptychographa xylographoides]